MKFLLTNKIRYAIYLVILNNEGGEIKLLSKDIDQMKKGILKILVLKLLSERKKYGYELLVEMDQKSNSFFKVKEGTLYPILYKLEDNGFVVSKWEIPSDRTKAKKYYFITPEGKQELDKLIVFWDSLTVNVWNVLKEKNNEK